MTKETTSARENLQQKINESDRLLNDFALEVIQRVRPELNKFRESVAGLEERIEDETAASRDGLDKARSELEEELRLTWDKWEIELRQVQLATEENTKSTADQLAMRIGLAETAATELKQALQEVRDSAHASLTKLADEIGQRLARQREEVTTLESKIPNLALPVSQQVSAQVEARVSEALQQVKTAHDETVQRMREEIKQLTLLLRFCAGVSLVALALALFAIF